MLTKTWGEEDKRCLDLDCVIIGWIGGARLEVDLGKGLDIGCWEEVDNKEGSEEEEGTIDEEDKEGIEDYTTWGEEEEKEWSNRVERLLEARTDWEEQEEEENKIGKGKSSGLKWTCQET